MNWEKLGREKNGQHNHKTQVTAPQTDNAEKRARMTLTIVNPNLDHSDRWWKGKYFAAEHIAKDISKRKKSKKWLSWAPAITQVF